MHTTQTLDLACAEFRSFGRKMPAFYLSIFTTMAATAIVFFDQAPWPLALGVPALVAVVSMVRARWWWMHSDDEVTPREAARHLRNATRLLVVASILIVSTDYALFMHGSASTRFFMIFELMASAMAGFYCLMHLRKSALLIGSVIMMPCLGMLYQINSGASLVAAINIMITFIVMSITMKGYHADFATLVRARAEAAQLADDNLRLANLDVLTGLPNRRRFFEQLQAIIDTTDARRPKLAIGIIDLDGFKPVNDTYGHRVGDSVLAQVAARLRTACPRFHAQFSSLCRLGGDEFAFLLTGEVDDATLHAVGQTIIETVSQPIAIGSLCTAVGCSVGYARFPEAAVEADMLYERADYALYQAKRLGRATVMIFSDQHAATILRHGMIEQTLRGADLNAEFFMEYQPIVNSTTGKTWAFEALARWHSAALGAVSPGQFIPVAEKSGLIAELTPVLLRKALATARTWPQEVHLSFNISSFDIASPERTAQLARIIEEGGVATGRIALEITESSLVNSLSQTRDNMETLRRLGLKISLDDFGTGYSSLGYLHVLPIDKLKVDRTFVQDIDTNPVSRNIVRSVLTLCRDMGLVCIIEGVETASQLGVLRQLGGSLIQGYLFSKPIGACEVAGYLAKEREIPSVMERRSQVA